MRFYFNEDNREPTCVLCGNKRWIEIVYCEDCKEWLCKGRCENNLVLRGMAMLTRSKKHLSERFA